MFKLSTHTHHAHTHTHTHHVHTHVMHPHTHHVHTHVMHTHTHHAYTHTHSHTHTHTHTHIMHTHTHTLTHTHTHIHTWVDLASTITFCVYTIAWYDDLAFVHSLSLSLSLSLSRALLLVVTTMVVLLRRTINRPFHHKLSMHPYKNPTLQMTSFTRHSLWGRFHCHMTIMWPQSPLISHMIINKQRTAVVVPVVNHMLVTWPTSISLQSPRIVSHPRTHAHLPSLGHLRATVRTNPHDLISQPLTTPAARVSRN